MTVIIRYHTPYLAYNKDLLIVLFALSDDISLRTVLCLPTLLAMGTTINLQRGTLACSKV